MEYRVLGTMEVSDGGQLVDVGARLPRTILAALIVDANCVVSVDAIIDRLWGESVPAAARAGLQAYIWKLRQVLEPNRPRGATPTVLVTQPPGYLLRVDATAVDALRFEKLFDEARGDIAAGEPAAAQAALERGLKLWRGMPYADLAFEPFLQPEITRLCQLRAAATETLAEVLLARGRNEQAVFHLQALVAAEELRERAWELLALALYRSGRQGDALRALNQARRRLGEELGIDPGPSLRRLELDILQQSSSLDWDSGAEVQRCAGHRCVRHAQSRPRLRARAPLHSPRR